MCLHKETLPEQTLFVFEELFQNEVMAATQGTLLGETALSLQINHRLSEDLGFTYFTDKLPFREISRLINDLKVKGFAVVNTLDQSKISQARINGYDLEDFIREYTINGVKVSFFVMNKGSSSRREYFKNAPILNTNGAFTILNVNSLFESKSVVLMDRVKSRDIYDLMVLIKNHGYQVRDIIDAIQTIDEKEDQQARAALDILTGLIPLDRDDPGFEPIGIEVDMSSVYEFFIEKVNDYESSIAISQLSELSDDQYDESDTRPT